MKILLMSPVAPPAGGIATWTKVYLKKINKNKNIIDLINTAVNGNRVKNLKKKSIIDELKRAKKIYIELSYKLNNNDYDILHINTSCGTLGIIRDYLYVRKANNLGVKVVMHCHCDTSHMVNNKVSELFFSEICKKSDKILSLNKQSYNHIKEKSGQESVIIPNFFRKDEFDKIKEKKYSSKIEKIIYVGHVIKTKGCDDILEVAKIFPNIEFQMVGYLSDEIKALGKSENVNFVGEVNKDEVIQRFMDADLLLFPSHTEGFPNVILEAMACGLPIISTPVGAIPEMLENKGAKYIRVQNILDIKRSIEEIKSIEVRENMGRWNKMKLKGYYLDDDVIEKLLKEYSSILEVK